MRFSNSKVYSLKKLFVVKNYLLSLFHAVSKRLEISFIVFLPQKENRHSKL